MAREDERKWWDALPKVIDGKILVHESAGCAANIGVKVELVIVPDNSHTASTLEALRNAALRIHPHGHADLDGKENWPIEECGNPMCVRIVHLIQQIEAL